MALGQNLEDMPIRLSHDLGDLQDVAVWNRFVEKITHRIDKDLLRGLPAKRIRELFRDQANVEALFKGMTWNSAKTLRKSFGIAVLTAGAYLRAAAHRIPRCVGPFDCSAE